MMSKRPPISPIDFKAASAIFRLAWSTYQKSSTVRASRLKKGWVESPFNPETMVNVRGLLDTIRLVDICLWIGNGFDDGGNRLTALNLKALSLRELGDFDAAIAAYETLQQWALEAGLNASLDQATKAIAECKSRKMNKV
jgi:hypothetical protein